MKYSKPPMNYHVPLARSALELRHIYSIASYFFLTTVVFTFWGHVLCFFGVLTFLQFVIQ